MEASVPNNFNLGSITGTTIGELKFYGQGAGMLPTANAVIQDIIDLLEEKNETAFDFSKEVEFCYDKIMKDYIIRTSLPEEKVREVFGENVGEREEYLGNYYYEILTISTKRLHDGIQQLQVYDKTVFGARIHVGTL